MIDIAKMREVNAEFEASHTLIKAIEDARDIPELAAALAAYLLDMWGDDLDDEQTAVDISALIAERGLGGEDAALFSRLVYEEIGLDRIRLTRAG
jgi:hypothetical protein